MKIDLEKLTADNHNVLLHFTAEWCGPCKRMQPNIELFLEENPNIAYVKVDVDDNGQFAMGMNVKSVPTLISYTGGQETNRVIGAQTLPDIRKMF